MMRLKCLACEVLARPLYALAAQSPYVVDLTLVERGLHSQPGRLRAHLQEEIDAAGSSYDAVLLAYGLCGQATAGLAARQTRLVLPRAHDCITLFLGSRTRYAEQFRANPGTYWYALDYLERDDGQGESLSMGSASEANLQAQRAGFVEKYGEDNADYLMEVMGAWRAHYSRAVYIDMGVGDGTAVEESARQEASRRGWDFERMAGDISLLKRLVQGLWQEDFLIIPPGQQVMMTYDENIIACQTSARPGC